MQLARSTAAFLLILFSLPAQAQRAPRRAGTIEGTVVEQTGGPRWMGIVVESAGSKYLVKIDNAEGPAPAVVGGDVRPVGTTVRVTYTGSEKRWDGTYALHASRVTMLTAPGAAQRRTEPDAGWQSFWTEFRAAVRKRDRIALRQLMTADFEWAGDGRVSAGEAITYLDQGIVSWKSISRSVGGRVVDCKFKDSSCWNVSGRQAKRTAGPERLVFELVANGRWKWVRLVGD